jgi:hypothetical protein
LRTEFAKTFFSVLLQVKGVFWRSARDEVVCRCGLPYQKMMTKLAGKNGTTNKPKLPPTGRSQLIGTSLLQGKGIPECFGSGTLNLTGRAIAPRVLLLEYLPHAQTLKAIAANLITQPIIDSLITTASSFGPLGVTHSDPNTGNFLFVVGQDGAVCRAVIIDFGSSYFREEESDEDWACIVRQQADVRFLKLRLEAKLKEMG